MTELRAGERLDRVNEQLTLICKEQGLTLGTDAYLLASFLRPAKRARAVELGTGTGILSLLCAARARLGHIDAWEIQPDFADLAERNVKMNGFDDCIRIHCGDIRTLCPEDIGGEADVVFSNPPYMPTEVGKRNDSDYQYIARHEVCGGIADFCAAAGRLLKYGGKFYCVFRPDRLADLMAALRENRLEPKSILLVHGDEAAEPSSVLVCAVKGGASGLRILPPLFLHEYSSRGEKNRALTVRATRIYETMSVYETAEPRKGRTKWNTSNEP